MSLRWFPALFCLALLAACASAPQSAAALPPTSTGACTERGWSDVTAALKKFDSVAKATSGPSSLQRLMDLQAARDAVAAAEVDPCYELEYEMILQATDEELYGYQILTSSLWCGEQSMPVPAELQEKLVCQSTEVAFSNIYDATDLLWQAKDQLAEMGIDLGFPLFGQPEE